MAFSKQPQISTYQTKPIKLAVPMDSRGSATNKDPQFLNVFFEQESKESKITHIVKRAGTEVFGPTLASSTVRGMYYWEDEDKIYVATGNDIEVIDAVLGTLLATLSDVFGTVSGEVGFTEFLYDDNTVKVVATDGTTLITIDAAHAVVTNADGDMPVHIPKPIFLDGYLFVVAAGTADIYNSNLNSPIAWTAGDFISCEMFADTVVRFTKLNNYLVVFGSASVEYFWDAGIATGSPLQRNDTPVKLVGYLGGLAQSGNRLYFVGNTATGLPDVFALEDFKIQAVGDESVRRYLESLTTALTGTIGNIVSFSGHDFYVMNVSTSTYVFDLKTQNWQRWAFKAFGNFTIEHAVAIKSNTTYASLIFVNAQTKLLKFSPTLYQDAGTAFTVEIYSALQMFETYNNKFMHRLVVVGDRPTDTALLSVSWTDDDYQTFVTSRTVNLNQAMPSLHQLGNFRRRAFKLTYTANFPLRINSLQVDLNMGQV